MSHSHFIRKSRPVNTYYITLYNIPNVIIRVLHGYLKNCYYLSCWNREIFFLKVCNIWQRLKNTSWWFSDREERLFQDESCNLNVSLKNRGLHRPDGRWWVGMKRMTGDKTIGSRCWRTVSALKESWNLFIFCFLMQITCKSQYS